MFKANPRVTMRHWTMGTYSSSSVYAFVPSGPWCQQHAAQGPLLSKILWHPFSMVNKCWRTKSEGQMRSATEALCNKGGIVEYRNASSLWGDLAPAAGHSDLEISGFGEPLPSAGVSVFRVMRISWVTKWWRNSCSLLSPCVCFTY